MSQNDFAKSLNLSRTAYSNYENDSRRMDIDKLFLISGRYGVSIEYLLDKTSNPTKSLNINNVQTPNGKLINQISSNLIYLSNDELSLINDLVMQFSKHFNKS